MKDGGRVFPTDVDFRDDGITRTRRVGGLSLRDYFAAHAPTADPIVLGSWEDADEQRAIYGACAENAYLWADAMLRAREKGDTS